jgi:hypothetical protein
LGILFKISYWIKHFYTLKKKKVKFIQTFVCNSNILTIINSRKNICNWLSYFWKILFDWRAFNLPCSIQQVLIFFLKYLPIILDVSGFIRRILTWFPKLWISVGNVWFSSLTIEVWFLVVRISSSRFWTLSRKFCFPISTWIF